MSSDREVTELERSISTLVSTVTVIVYLIVSFWTHAWHITWVIFPLVSAVKGVAFAMMHKKEEENHEN